MSEDESVKNEFEKLNKIYDYWCDIHSGSIKLKDGKKCNNSMGGSLDIPLENDSQYTGSYPIDPDLLEYSIKDIKKSHLMQIAQGRINSDEELSYLAYSYQDLAPFLHYEEGKDYQPVRFDSDQIDRMSKAEGNIDEIISIGLDGTVAKDIFETTAMLNNQISAFYKVYPPSKYYGYPPSNEQTTVTNDKSSGKSIYEAIKSECLYLIASSPPKSNFIMNGLSYAIDFSAAIALFLFIVFPLIYFSEERATISDVYPVLGILISVYVVKKIFGFK